MSIWTSESLHPLALSEEQVGLYQSETVGNKKRVWVEAYDVRRAWRTQNDKGILMRGGYNLSTELGMSD